MLALILLDEQLDPIRLVGITNDTRVVNIVQLQHPFNAVAVVNATQAHIDEWAEDIKRMNALFGEDNY